MLKTNKLFLAFLVGLFSFVNAFADYTKVPFSLNSSGQFSYTSDTGTYTFSTKTGYYQEWDHYVIFWSTGYGSKTGTVTTLGSGDYLLNLTQMKQYAELCYDNYIKLGFLTPTNKIIILAYYTKDWEATGTGEGNYGILNISHASANPSANYYTFCHEIAHAYQYLGNQKNGGNAGFQYGTYYGYVSYYECCGNWQAAQEYPAMYFPQSVGIYNKTTNLNWLHSWHCYQSYIFNDYFTEKCGQTTIGDIWTVNTNTKYADPLEKYMYNTGASAEDVYREIFYAAMRTVTWDLDRWNTYLTAQGVSRDKYMDHRMGTKAGTNGATTTPVTYSDTYYPTSSTYQYVTTNSSSAIHQVAYSSCPQSTGFNVIKLNVPTSSSNRKVTTTFTALAPGASLASGDNKEYWCGSMWAQSSSQSKYNTGGLTSEATTTYNTYKSWRGFRLGYVTYKKSTGKRYYNFTDKVYCTGTSETSVNISFDVPSDVDSLYLVVSPALSQYLRVGSVDPYSISSNAGFVSTQQRLDQWPYRVQFYNTNIYGLSNPSTTFSGSAETGTTYTSETLPDLAGDQTEKTYTIQVASGSPSGAGFTVASDLTSAGSGKYTTTITLTNSNVAGYVYPTEVDGYAYSIAVSGTTVTITYKEVGPSMTIQRNIIIPIDSEYSGTTAALTSTEQSAIASFLGISSTNFKSTSYWIDDYDNWAADGPTTGKCQLFAVSPDDATTLSTHNYSATPFPGFWYNTSEEAITYGDGDESLFVTYDIGSATFTIGQFPDALSQGNTYTIRQAIVYNNAGTNYTVYLVFNVSMAASGTTPSTTYSYTVKVVNDPGTGGITTKTGLTLNSAFGTYECATELTSSNIATYATAKAVTGYTAVLTVSGSVITVTYTKATADPTITASPTSLAFASAYVDDTYTKTFTVTGTNLKGNITLTKSGNAAFTIDQTSITRSGTSATATVTVTYAPTAAGSHTGTVTLASSGATSVTVSLSGTAQVKVPVITANPTSLSFSATAGALDIKTLNVSGTFLTDDIAVSVSGTGFSVSTTSVYNEEALASGGRSINVGFTAPTTAGTYTGTLTLTSTGAETVTIPLTGVSTPTTTTTTIYQLTNTLIAGGEYLVVSRNTAGAGYALGHSGTTVAADAVTVKADDEISVAAYILSDDVDDTSVMTVASGYTFKNGNYYLRCQRGSISFNSSNSSNWTWDGTNNRLSYKGMGSTYYLCYSSGFSVATSNNSVYLYKKTTVTIEAEAAQSIDIPISLATERSTDYTPQYVTLTDEQVEQINTFFGVSDFTSLDIYDVGQQAAGTAMFFAVNPSDGTLAVSESTQYHPGHWFDKDGNVCSWGEDARVWIHFFQEETEINEDGDTAPARSFEIGQMEPIDEDDSAFTNGDVFTPAQALRYYDGTSYKTVYFRYTITVGDPTPQDITGDGQYDEADIQAIIDIIFGIATNDDYPGDADLNGDGKVSLADLTKVIDRVIAAKQ